MTRPPFASPAAARRTASLGDTASRTAVARTAVALAASLLVALALAAPVGAHSDEGEMEITTLDRVSADAIAVEVGIRYSNDDHLAKDAAVQATAIGPDGRSVGPVELSRVSEDGSLYAGELTGAGPGSWTVQVDSTDPVAAATGTVEVSGEPGGGTAAGTADSGGTDTSAAPSTTARGADASSTEAPSTEVQPGPVNLDSDPMASGDDLEGGLPFVAFVGAVAAVVVTGGALTIVRRRENTAREAEMAQRDSATESD